MSPHRQRTPQRRPSPQRRRQPQRPRCPRRRAHAHANADSVRRPHAHVGAGGNRDRNAPRCDANARVAACPALRRLARVGARLEQPAGGRRAGPEQPRFRGGTERPGRVAAERGVPASSGVRDAAGDSRVPRGRSPPAARVRPRPQSSHNVEALAVGSGRTAGGGDKLSTRPSPSAEACWQRQRQPPHRRPSPRLRLAERATPTMPTGNTNAEPYRHANRNPAPTSHRHANAASYATATPTPRPRANHNRVGSNSPHPKSWSCGGMQSNS